MRRSCASLSLLLPLLACGEPFDTPADVAAGVARSLTAEGTLQPVDIEADARHCELSVFEFARWATGKYGSGSVERTATLRTRPGDHVLGVGAYLRAHEVVTTRAWNAELQDYDPPVVTDIGEQDFFVEGRPVYGAPNLWYVPLLERSNLNGDSHVTTRDIRHFAYYVEIQTDEGRKRLWLKGGDWNFTPADYDESRYPYAHTTFLSGYTSATYLWRDSGSPLFESYWACN